MKAELIKDIVNLNECLIHDGFDGFIDDVEFFEKQVDNFLSNLSTPQISIQLEKFTKLFGEQGLSNLFMEYYKYNF